MKKYLFGLFVAFLVSGCVSATKEGLTLSITPQTMQQNIAKEFPIKRELKVGKLELQDPKVGLKEGSDKVETGMTFIYKSPIPLIPELKGTIDLAGNILYNRDKGSFYLQNPEVKKLSFNNQTLEKYVPNNLKMILGSIANEIFKKYPIYKLSADSLQGKFLQSTVKKAEVKNGVLEITFGMPEIK